jgi:trigger factor
MENLLQNQALLEPADRPAKLGDQVTFEHISVSVVVEDDDLEAVEDLEAELEAAMAEEADADAVALEVEDLEEDEEDGAEIEDEADDLDDDEDYDGEDEEEETILHEHDFNRVLRDDKEDFFPGFSAQIVGLSQGEEKEFFLDVPASDDLDDRIAGKRLHVELHMGQVQARTVPEWSDELAKRISEEKFETILDLRVDTRKQMQDMAVNQANQTVAMQALDKIVEGASVAYPEELVQDYISDLLEDLERNVLRQQGFTLKDYMKLTGQTMDQIRERYRDSAIKRAQRSLVMAEVVRAEKIEVSSTDIDAEIDRIAGQLGGEQSGQFRQFLSTPQSRMNIGTEMVTTRVMDRLAAIAKGENPSIATDEPEIAPVAEAASESAPESGTPESSEPTAAQES